MRSPRTVIVGAGRRRARGNHPASRGQEDSPSERASNRRRNAGDWRAIPPDAVRPTPRLQGAAPTRRGRLEPSVDAEDPRVPANYMAVNWTDLARRRDAAKGAFTVIKEAGRMAARAGSRPATKVSRPTSSCIDRVTRGSRDRGPRGGGYWTNPLERWRSTSFPGARDLGGGPVGVELPSVRRFGAAGGVLQTPALVGGEEPA